MWKKAALFVFPSLGALLFGGALITGIPARIASLKSSYELYASPPLAEVSPRYINLFLFGHKALYDDYIAIWLLQTLMQPGMKDPEKLMKQIRSVVQHHPKLETTYTLACFVLMQDANSPQNCREVTDAGLVAFPMSWRLLMTQAYVEYFKLNHPAQAASYFMMAAQREIAPPYVRKVAEKLLVTKQLSDEDVQKSMEIIAHSSGNSQFIEILKKADKANKPSEATP